MARLEKHRKATFRCTECFFLFTSQARRCSLPPNPPGGEVPWFHSLGKNILIRIVLRKSISGFFWWGARAVGRLKAGNQEARERSKMGRCYRGKKSGVHKESGHFQPCMEVKNKFGTN